jgi:hypothetical protein
MLQHSILIHLIHGVVHSVNVQNCQVILLTTINKLMTHTGLRCGVHVETIEGMANMLY